MPNPDASLEHVISGILHGLARWGAPIVFVAMFVDCLPFAAFIAPGVIMLVLTGFVAASQTPAQGTILVLAAAAGVISSDTLMYGIGRAGYSKSTLVRRVIDKREKLKTELATQSTLLLFFYQFPPYSRMFAPLIMGSLHFGWRRWLALASCSTVLFVGSFFALGLAAGLSGGEAAGATKDASSVSTIFLFGFLVWLGGLVVRLIRVRRAQGQEA